MSWSRDGTGRRGSTFTYVPAATALDQLCSLSISAIRQPQPRPQPEEVPRVARPRPRQHEQATDRRASVRPAHATAGRRGRAGGEAPSRARSARLCPQPAPAPGRGPRAGEEEGAPSSRADREAAGALPERAAKVLLLGCAAAVAESDDEVRIRWNEAGGATGGTKDPLPGFGSRLIDLAIKQQLGGNYERRWTTEGLEIEMNVKRARLVENA